MIYIFIVIAVIIVLVIFFIMRKQSQKEPYVYELVDKAQKIELSEEERVAVIKEAIKEYKKKHENF